MRARTKFEQVLAELSACKKVRTAISCIHRGSLETALDDPFLATGENIGWLYNNLLVRARGTRYDGSCLNPFCGRCRTDNDDAPTIVLWLARQPLWVHKIILKAAIKAYKLKERT